MSDTPDADSPPQTADAPAPAPKQTWLHAPLALFWNGQERRLRTLWRIAGLIVVFLILGAAINATGVLPEPGSDAALIASSLGNASISLIGVAIAGRLFDRRRLREYGLVLDRGWFADLGFGLGLGAVLMSAIFLVEWALGWVTVTGTLRAAEGAGPFGRAILVPVLVFFGVGIFEELIARGYLLHNFAEGLSVPALGGARGGLGWAVLISSAIFALGHVDNPNATLVSTLNIALAGGLLALGYVLTGQLAIPIGLHITWNLFQASAFGFPVSGVTSIQTTFIAIEQGGPDIWTGGVFGPEAGLLGLIAMLAGAAATLLWVRWRLGEIRLVTSLTEPPRRAPLPEAQPQG